MKKSFGVAASAMRIAVNLAYLHPGVGGSLIYTSRLVEALVQRSDLSVGLFGLDERVATLVLPAEVLQAVPRIPLPGSRVAARMPRQARRAYAETIGSALSRGLADYDVIWSPGNTAAWRPQGRPPGVVTLHDLLHLSEHSELDRKRTAWRRVAFRRAVSASAFVLTPSEQGREELIREYGLDSERVVSTAEGVDTSCVRTFGDTVDADYIICPASNHPHKNHRLLFEAFKGSDLWRQGTRLLLVGWRYPKGCDLSAAAARAGLSETTCIDLGYIDDHGQVLDLIARSRAVVLPSVYEGWSLPALEGLALGRPVLAHAVGGIPEFAEFGVSVVTSQGDVSAWRRSLDGLAGDETDARHAARNRAVGVIEKYSWDSVADRLVDVFRRCMIAQTSTGTSTGRVETG